MAENRAEATHSFKTKMTELEFLLGIFGDEDPHDVLLSCARFFEQAVTVPYSKSRPQLFYEYTNENGQKFSCSLLRQANAEYVLKTKCSWMEPASIKVPRNSQEIIFEEVWRLGELNVNAAYSFEYAPAGSLRKFAIGELELNSDSIKVLRERLEELEKDAYERKIYFPVSRETLDWQPQRKNELLARMEREVGALLGRQIFTHPSWSAALLGDSPTLPAKAKPGENKSVKDGEGRNKGQKPKPNPLEIFKTQVDACAEALKMIRKSEIEIVFMSQAELAAHLEQVESIHAEAARLYKNALGMGSSMAHIDAVNNAFANFRESIIRYK